MASSWFLIIMTFKFLHHVAWPLLALVYPMCASVQAIETDSYEETKHLISYWILLSLIYLFEYAFMSLLPWFQLWMYIKILFIFWLTIPDFGRASYVYNNLISSMKLQIVTWRSNNYWKKWFFDKDDFLMHAERYMKENGTEALEKLIASKNTMCRPDSKVTNEIIVTDDKEMLKTNGERIQIEQNDIKNLEAIEKQEILVTKQQGKMKLYRKQTVTNMSDEKWLSNSEGIPVMPIIGPSPNASSATVETKGTTESDIVDGEVPQSSTSTEKEVQKEWTCALCLVTAQGEKVWNSHLSGRKHRASLQKQKEPEVTNKIITAGNKEVLEDIPVMPKIEPSQNASSATVETKGTAESDRAGGEVPQSSTSTQMEVQKQSTCALCLLTTTCEKNMTMHLNGKRHRAALQKQKDAEVTNQLIATDNKKILKTNGERLQTEDEDIKDSEIIEKKEIPSTKQDILIMPKIGPSQNASSATVETKGSDTVGGEVPQSSTSTQKQVQKQWTCALCLLTVACEKDMNSHLNGKKHRANLRSFES